MTVNGMKGSGASTDDNRVLSPPYVSYVTFRNVLTWLESEGIPVRFDRSFWETKFSGGTGIQLIGALRFLGLLQGDEPQLELHRLVEAKGNDRKALLKEVITKRYKTIHFDVLKGATPAMIEEWFKLYPSIDGDTLRKAQSFFINACKDAEIDLSKTVSKKARLRAPRAKSAGTKEAKSTKVNVGTSEQDGTLDAPPPNKPRGTGSANETRITLGSGGGEVVVGVNVDLFKLSKSDRDFVLSLIDLAQSYKKSD